MMVDHPGKTVPVPAPTTPAPPVVAQAQPAETTAPPTTPVPPVAPVPAPTAPERADQPTPASPAPTPTPTPAPTPTPTAAPALAEERAQAACHPGLARAPDVPQIDIGAVPQPGSARLKYRIWVNAGGIVVRDELVGGALGSEAERVAAERFLYQMYFNIPEGADCSGREMELVASFFEHREKSGQWGTFIAVHPRLWADERGMVHVSD